MDIIKIITRRHLNFNSLLILIKEWSNAFSSRFTTSWFKEKYFKFYHTILCCYRYINFARRLLIRSLVSILHNLFSISRQHISFLARFQTGKKTGFLKKKILVAPSFVSFYMRPRFYFLPYYPLHFLIPSLMMDKNTEYMFFTIKVCQGLVSNPRPLTIVYL